MIFYCILHKNITEKALKNCKQKKTILLLYNEVLTPQTMKVKDKASSIELEVTYKIEDR